MGLGSGWVERELCKSVWILCVGKQREKRLSSRTTENSDIIFNHVKGLSFDDSLSLAGGIWSSIRIHWDSFLANHCWHWSECLEDIYSIVVCVGFLCSGTLLGCFYLRVVFENWLEVIFLENTENYVLGKRTTKRVVVGDSDKSKPNEISVSRHVPLYEAEYLLRYSCF